MFLTIVAFLFVIGILILVHEFGHFVAAKLSGIKVLEFSIFFPPRIASFKKNETNYSIGALPLGGYVKMLGEDEESKDPRAFNTQKPGKRFLVSVAGVIMNFLLAWIILTTLFIIGTTPIATPSDQIGGRIVKPQIYVAEVIPSSPAEKAGIIAGDQLISGSVNSDNIEFKSTTDVSNFTKSNVGKTVIFTVKREDKTLAESVDLNGSGDAPFGVALVDQAVVKVAWYKAPVVALRETWAIIRITFDFLGSFLHQLVTKAEISNQVGGPVAIFNLSGMAAREGASRLFQLIALLSINLGLINILPFPALDGGRAIFIILEKICGKRIVKENVEGIIHTVGFVLLILLIVAITYKDILRLIHK